MGDFATGFVTGFANTLADGVNERTAIARDYFQKQYEIATTVGLENHRKVESQVEASAKTAQQLQQMGVPRDIIMAVASQDPLSLGDFYAEIAAAQKSGVPIDEQFFKDFVTVSGEFKAPDEDFATFFRKALTPISQTASSNPEAFKRDRKGGIFGALMGADPYGRAQEKLDNTVVIDGLSASDLARYGQDYRPAGVENAPTVSFDYSATAKRKSSDLSVAETTAINKEIEDTMKRMHDEARLRGENPNVLDFRKAATDEVAERYGHIPEVVRYLEGGTGSTEEEITEEALPPTGQELEEAGIGTTPAEPAPEAVPTEAPETVPTVAPVPEVPAPAEEAPTPSETAPTAPAEGMPNSAPINPEEEGLYKITIKGLTLMWESNNDDGTVTYRDADGEAYDFDPAEVRQYVAQFGG
jgi:hypothetical protein